MANYIQEFVRFQENGCDHDRYFLNDEKILECSRCGVLAESFPTDNFQFRMGRVEIEDFNVETFDVPLTPKIRAILTQS
jgi:hypothetical protein